MGTIESAQLDELTRALEEHGVKYLYIGKSAAIVHGFADTTQDADIFLDHSGDNKANVIRSLEHIGFKLTQQQKDEIKTGRDFVQFHNNGPFDVDLVFAPDGIEKFSDAWDRGRKILVLSPTAVSYAFVEARGVAATSPPGGPMAAWSGPGFAAGAYSTVMSHRAPAVRAGAIRAAATTGRAGRPRRHRLSGPL